METTNTFRAIIMGTAMLFGGCLLWLSFSLQEIKELQGKIDRAKLKNESLEAEKLSVDKALTKKDKKIKYLEDASIKLHQAGAAKHEILAVLRGNSQKLSESLMRVKSELDSSTWINASLTALYRGRTDSINMLTLAVERQRDSIKYLQNYTYQLKRNLNEAKSRSARQPLFYAREKDGNATSTAKRAVDFFAQLEIPSDLKPLKFRIENARGTILADDEHMIIEYLPASPASMATFNEDFLLTSKQEIVQVLFRPQNKITSGEYELKIFDGNVGVGSALVKLK